MADQSSCDSFNEPMHCVMGVAGVYALNAVHLAFSFGFLIATARKILRKPSHGASIADLQGYLMLCMHVVGIVWSALQIAYPTRWFDGLWAAACIMIGGAFDNTVILWCACGVLCAQCVLSCDVCCCRSALMYARTRQRSGRKAFYKEHWFLYMCALFLRSFPSCPYCSRCRMTLWGAPIGHGVLPIIIAILQLAAPDAIVLTSQFTLYQLYSVG